MIPIAATPAPVITRPILSDPVFHDVIVAFIRYNAAQVYELCKTIPSLKSSSLLSGKTWIFDPDRLYKEHATQTTYHENVIMDNVWRFFHKGNPQYGFWLTHEVKTGRFDPVEVKEKYYYWQTSQIWIWGWERYTPKTLPRHVRFAPLEYLMPMIKPHVDTFAEFLKPY